MNIKIIRLLATLCCILFVALAKSQAGDSTELQLQHYKSLYENKLINNGEYQRLKSRLLHIPFDLYTDPDSIAARILHDRYRGKIAGGSVMICLGMTLVLVDATIYQLALRNNSVEDLRSSRPAFIATGLVGGITAFMGGVVLGLGLKDKFIFSNQYLAIMIVGNDNQIGLACDF